MQVTKKIIHTSDVTSKTTQELLNWGFSKITTNTILTQLMVSNSVQIYKNDSNDLVDYQF